jgi:hypothetical protein
MLMGGNARIRRMSRSAVSNAQLECFSAPRRPLRRLTLELFGIIALKIVAPTLIWRAAFAPQPKPNVGSHVIAQQLAPTSHGPPEAQP